MALPIPDISSRVKKSYFDYSKRDQHTSETLVFDRQSCWRWPQRNLAGNTIDFFVQVLGMNFHNAMRQITGS
jgi:hypothetical protein